MNNFIPDEKTITIPIGMVMNPQYDNLLSDTLAYHDRKAMQYNHERINEILSRT